MTCSSATKLSFTSGGTGGRAKPAFKALMPIAPGRGYPGEFQCVDLSIDPSEYAFLPPEELVQEITVGPKPGPIDPDVSTLSPSSSRSMILW